MNVAGMIEWLKSMPQDAKVSVLSHSDGHGYYMQGGSCTTEAFHNIVEYAQWKDEGDTSRIEYIYGCHFELQKLAEGFVLQIGVMGK